MILVTGGAGFIGSHVVDALLAAGTRCAALDALLPAAHRERPGYLAGGAEWLEGDLRDPDGGRARRRAASTRCRHQAAMVGLGVDLGDLPDYVGHNDLGHRAAAARAALRRLRRAARARVEHGRLRRGPLRVPGPRRRAAPATRAAPTSTPGASSRAARAAAARWRRETVPRGRAARPAQRVRRDEARPGAPVRRLRAARPGCRSRALRYHNVYGPRMPRDTPYAGVASIFRSALAAGRAPRVFEDGGQRRDFVHVRDVARANVLALTAPEPVAPGAFNVASGTPRTVLEHGRARSPRACDAPPGAAPRVTGEWRAGDVRHVVASPAPRRRAARLRRRGGLRRRHGGVRHRAAARVSDRRARL